MNPTSEREFSKNVAILLFFFALLLQWTIYDFKHARIAYERRRRNKMHVSVSRSYMANNVPLKYHLICTGIRVRICIIWLFGIVYVYVTKCFARKARTRWQMPHNPSCSCVCVYVCYAQFYYDLINCMHSFVVPYFDLFSMRTNFQICCHLSPLSLLVYVFAGSLRLIHELDGSFFSILMNANRFDMCQISFFPRSS